MERRGFTLLELMIVIIIVGTLATIAIVQYQASVEKSRASEARSVIGSLRTACAGIWNENTNTSYCTHDLLRVGTDIPDSASASGGKFWFWYNVTNSPPNATIFKATRFTNVNSKNPPGKTAGTVILNTNFGDGTESWSGSGEYQ